MLKENWYGTKIHEYIKIKNIQVMYGKKEVIIVFFETLKTADIIEYYAVLNYYFKKREKIECGFGLLLNNSMKVIRKKIKNELIRNFSEENLISLFSGTSEEAFYSPKPDLDFILGIEIRFEKEINSWYNKEEEFIRLLREIGEEKKKIFLENDK